MATAQEQILSEVLSERDAQDKKWGGANHDNRHHIHDWIAFLVRHTGLAVTNDQDVVKFRQQMIRVAALAVAAVESCDRWAALGSSPKAAPSPNVPVKRPEKIAGWKDTSRGV